MATNTKENGFENLIVEYLVNNNAYEKADTKEYDKEYAIDTKRLFRFLESTQAEEFKKTRVATDEKQSIKFLSRLKDEITKRGIIDVLRKGYKFDNANLVLFYMSPSGKNPKAKENYEKNIFSVIQQLEYAVNSKLALDLGIFINGLPLFTCELKNQLTGQNVEDAILQYKSDRDPKELIFNFKRCASHFAIEDKQIKFCTKLDSKKSWFLPFDKGYKDGAGNPPNPDGIMTDYFWKDILSKNEITNIIENYAQVIKKEDEDTKKTSYSQIFPRYHQLNVVKALLADVAKNGIGRKYLIQHSAGSGKSNSIAWLAHQLVSLEKNDSPIVNSIIIVTDRINLDKQITATVKHFMQMQNKVTRANSSSELKDAITNGKSIIITTVQKFPFILDSIGTDHKNNNFAIIIDEAHSSQSGSMSAKMNMALAGEKLEAIEDIEDKINALIEGRKMLTNASYFAFTATPKNKTLEMFGEEYTEAGEKMFKPFHVYTMKQAIQEQFILDVLKNYTPYNSFYKLTKKILDDPSYDKKKAQKKLRAYVESRPETIAKKAQIIVEHFHDQVLAKKKIAGKARAMVVSSSIEKAIDYYYAIDKALKEIQSPYKAIVAFSGEKEYAGEKLTESSINKFATNEIEKKFKEDEYRFLVVANKFQTGYDEPLLHTMYVDKVLSDIKAVQTLSRLNRAHPDKHDTFVLDFANSAEDIEQAFAPYYKTTHLLGETDPNKLHNLVAELEEHEVYDEERIDTFIRLYLSDAPRQKLDPILDYCVPIYKELEEEAQVSFKSSAKAFVRMYGFLGAIMPFGSPEWEKLHIFLTLLLPKLPSPKIDDLAEGILENIDLDSYRVQAKASVNIQLEDEDGEIMPVPTSTASGKPEPELDSLSNIVSEFNNIFGDIQWENTDTVRLIVNYLPEQISKNEDYQNAMNNSDEQNTRAEFEKVLRNTMNAIMKDNIELYKQFSDNPRFREWLSDSLFHVTYNPPVNEHRV